MKLNKNSRLTVGQQNAVLEARIESIATTISNTVDPIKINLSKKCSLRGNRFSEGGFKKGGGIEGDKLEL